MKLPVNFLLYVLTLGLCAFAGWTVYEAWLLERQDNEQHAKGQQEAMDRVALGRKGSAKVETVRYNTTTWLDQWMGPNLLGKDPPKPVEQVEDKEPEPVPEVDLTPLEEIIELLVLFHDGAEKGEGGQSHVVVAYRDTADVQPPRWYELENQQSTQMGTVSRRRDTVPSQGRRGRNGNNGRGGGRGRQGNPTASQLGKSPRGPSMPMSSTAGREVVQTLWAAGDGSKKFEATLWPPYDYIKLVRVAADGRSAFFVRVPPPPADGETAPEVVEEELFQTTMDISQDVLKQIAEVNGRDPGRMARQGEDVPAPGSQWRDVQETTEINGVFHIGSNDRDSFAKDENDFLGKINVSSYQSPLGTKLRGLRVMDISPEIRGRFGIQRGDVILSVNGKPVSTKAQAISVGKRMHQRGVRRFTVRLLSNGQEIERVYQAPDDR
ncbi:MAG: hypothetical protein VYE77_11255 [Planctomycetota bacterium]|nr:hypothetical protein [Planctomycetota bacterium]